MSKEAPKVEAAKIETPEVKVEPGRRDLACAQLFRHVPNCTCTKEMRAPVPPAIQLR